MEFHGILMEFSGIFIEFSDNLMESITLGTFFLIWMDFCSELGESPIINIMMKHGNVM